MGGGAGSVVDSEENDSDRELEPQRISDDSGLKVQVEERRLTKSCPPINLFGAG